MFFEIIRLRLHSVWGGTSGRGGREREREREGKRESKRKRKREGERSLWSHFSLSTSEVKETY
jgi:hypothetical protein